MPRKRTLSRAVIRRRVSELPLRPVAVPEWGDGVVYAKQVSVNDAFALMERYGKGTDDVDAIVTWCILGICDRNRRPIFSEDDRSWLKDSPIGPIQRCAAAVLEVNGLTEDAEDQRKKK